MKQSIKDLSKIISVLTMLLIIYFSHQPGNLSLQQSNFFLKYFGPIFDFLKIDIRKFAHFFIYLCLGFFLTLSKNKITKKNVFITIFFIFLFACSDEYHQTFIHGRAGQLKDVFIDTLGGTIGSITVILALYYLTK